MHLLPARTSYSRAEFVSDTIIHVSGLVLALIAVPVLVALTHELHGKPEDRLGVIVYGATFLAMILFSALYNTLGSVRWTWLLQRLDHGAIYIKIAGTYTPFLVLSGQAGGTLLTGLWVAAGTGVALKIASPVRFRWLALSLYVGMGWVGLVAGDTLFGHMATPVVVLIFVAGLIYMAGVVFYLFDRLPFHYTIWHALVLAASFVLYAAVTVHVLLTAA